MTKDEKQLAALQIEQSEVRQKLNDLFGKEDRTAEETAELETLTKRAQAIEPELRAALVLVQGEEPEGKATDTMDAETRERLELRGKCSVTRYLEAALKGRRIDGAEAEYAAAEAVEGIPLALWDEPPAAESREKPESRTDVVTGAPGTVGVNLQPIRPAVFAASIAPRLRIEMPRVMSGTYAEARIDTSLTAAMQAAGDAAMASAATFAVSTATPKRLSGRLGIRIEDIAAVGQANYESALRSNLGLVMSAAMDDQAINGDGSGNNLNGILNQLTGPANNPTAIATFDEFYAKFADGVDGLWASTVKEIGIVAGPKTYALSAKTFQTAASFKGEIPAASHLMMATGGWWTNKRMPDPDGNNYQAAILHRLARQGLRTAVCPNWGALNIDDVYSGSASGTRYVSFHVLLGDIIIVQPGAYAEVAYQVA